MSTSPNLGLDYIVASQAQKEVTHNQALNHLDALVQAVVVAMDINTPPTSPDEGAVYIIGSAPTGAWLGQVAGTLALYYSGWYFKTPREGWRVYLESSDAFAVFDGSAWKISELKGSYTWNPGTVAAGSSVSSSVLSLTGAALGDFALAAAPYALSGLLVSAHVSSANGVRIVLFNPTASGVTLSSGMWALRILK